MIMEFINESLDTVDKTKTVHAEDPYVATYDNIITPQECDHFIELSKPSLQRALVSDNNKGVISSGRTGMNTWIKHDHDNITMGVAKRIADIVDMPLENAEAFQVIYYGITQEYRKHYDSWIHDRSEKTLRCMKYGGARIKTALCYLNDVQKGGGTCMSRLNITIPAKKGKLLVFHNTKDSVNNHDVHPLAEHAGMPVEEGEKYAFNLWFRECSRSVLYSDFNPSYYVLPDAQTSFLTENINGINVDFIKQMKRLHIRKTILRMDNFFPLDLKSLLNVCKFSSQKRRECWVKLNTMKDFQDKLESSLGIHHVFFENMHVVEYTENNVHGRHFTSYDINSETGKKFTSSLGQRVFTISLCLSKNMRISFPSLQVAQTFNYGDILVYKNTQEKSSQRDGDLERVVQSLSGTGYLLNVYVREKSGSGKHLSINLPEESQVDAKAKLENYHDTLNSVFELFKEQKVGRAWNRYESFSYNFKGNFDAFKEQISVYDTLRRENKGINRSTLERTYDLDANFPLQIVNNVFCDEFLRFLQKYYSDTISKNVWQLGDRQSKRYKAHDEPMSRFVHYELLPVIEKIVGKSLKPTYSYLSAYVKGADLPPHTDRPDCEYTVSLLVDKPKSSHWNIYLHKKRQDKKYKGRYDTKPPLDECESVDCDAGGLMLFQGIDRIHFRETLEFDYYNILLLHYCSI